MKDMRTIIILILAAAFNAAGAQTVDEMLDKAEQACMQIRSAVDERSTQGVMQGMEMLEVIAFRNLTLKPVNTDGSAPIRGHLQYTMQYLDSLLLHDLDMGLIQIDGPIVMRGNRAPLRCTHRAVAPGASVTYAMEAQGQQALLVVPENGGRVNLYVDEKASGRRLADESPEGKESCRLSWTVEKPSALNVTVENKSAKAVSFIVVSN